MNEKIIDDIIKAIAIDWQVPVSMLIGREPKTAQEKQDSEYFLAAVCGATTMTDNIITLCARIQVAATKCDTLHVFCSYSPHVSTLTVVARDIDHDYGADVDDWPDPLMYEVVYLDDRGAVDRLNDVIGKLESMGVVV